MAEVTWLPVAQADGYEVSSDGRVRSVDRVIVAKDGSRRPLRGQELKLRVKTNGYLGGMMWVVGRRIDFHVHRLVCAAFHGCPPHGLQVRHLNGNCLDNRVENLAWGTGAENAQDRFRHGTAGVHKRKTHCPQGHEFTPENTVQRRVRGYQTRYCRECSMVRRRRPPRNPIPTLP